MPVIRQELQVRPVEYGEEFEIDSMPIWSADDGRLDPIFLAEPPWFEFDELGQRGPEPVVGAVSSLLPVEFDEAPQLDPERGEEPGEPWPATGRQASAISFFGSTGMHLLVLLGLINWSSVPAENPQPMPMQLVFEEPASQEEKPPSRIVPDTEIISAQPAETAGGAAGAKAPPPPRPPPTKLATDKPPPKPSHAAAQSHKVKPKLPPEPRPPPEARPSQLAAAAPATPAPPTPDSPPPTRMSPAASQLAQTPNPSPHEAQTLPGPDQARSDYFSRLVALTRGHLDLLPSSFLAGRRGQTTLSIVVLSDGSIGRISVKRGSGYPDIDARIEQMVSAVGRFPAPPEWFPKPSIELDFNLIFPDALP
jgi:TonB family protein